MIIGTAGHIDHGKTALVRALTGVDTDRLPEEKRRGMTIDLGFAYRTIPADGGAAAGTALGFVDVPGHERFVHNMLAGATGIDFVLLVVAADDGPMPQTREHLDILSLLGLARGVVALTKADLVSPERLAEATGEVRRLLAGSTLGDAEIVPVSSATGSGIAGLEALLLRAAAAQGPREPHGGFRLAIDRSFVLAGIGIVVTGTVVAGRIAAGDHAVLSPSGIAVRVRSIHAHNRAAPTGREGQRCALNLAGAQLERELAQRGAWVVAPSLHAPTDRIDVRLRLLRHDAKPLRAGLNLHLHLGTARVAARLAPLDGEALLPGAVSLVQLVLERPIAAWRGDRLILRDAAATRTIGGGVVLDPFPPARGRRRPERLAALSALARPQPAEALAALLEATPAGVDLDRFALASGLTPGEALAAAKAAGARLLKADEHRLGFAMTPARLGGLRRAIEAALAAHHLKSPESPGLEFDRLRSSLSDRLRPPVFGALVAALVGDGALARRGAAIHLPGHAAALPEYEERLWARIRRRLDETGFDPPWVRDLARELAVSESAARRLMKRLAQMGEVVEVVPDRFYRRRTVQQMAAMLAEMSAAAGGGAVTAAAFRDRIGTGRKLAILILEFFDRSGLTTRRGDLRTIRQDRVQRFGEPVR
jgi:selenocysteine-specific elongation factor